VSRKRNHITCHVRGKKEAFGNLGIIFAITAIEVLVFVVQAHHIFTVGMDGDTRGYFTSAKIIIVVPTGIKTFRLLSAMYGSQTTYRTTCI
jgi:heme/copper-type cytochrome/quinol oxidase subunit 1